MNEGPLYAWISEWFEGRAFKLHAAERQALAKFLDQKLTEQEQQPVEHSGKVAHSRMRVEDPSQRSDLNYCQTCGDWFYPATTRSINALVSCLMSYNASTSEEHTHRLVEEHMPSPTGQKPYRYRCVDCNQRLKLLSGVLLKSP